ncbi:hypothetical protein OEZ86_008854 [Tetradesmus obliquus]|nr:hypothetical protein OEZ86_008854 [Tetradesmus obliquus]
MNAAAVSHKDCTEKRPWADTSTRHRRDQAVHDSRWVKNAVKSAYSLPTLQQALQQHGAAMDAACCAAAVAKLAHLAAAAQDPAMTAGQASAGGQHHVCSS